MAPLGFHQRRRDGNHGHLLQRALWHSGTDKDNLFGEMVRFHIGCNGNGGNDYRGDVDEFRMWNAALTPTTVADFYNRSRDASHPNADDLLLEVSMDINPDLNAIGDGVTHFSHGNAGDTCVCGE